jgi:hypothetical protein
MTHPERGRRPQDPPHDDPDQAGGLEEGSVRDCDRRSSDLTPEEQQNAKRALRFLRTSWMAFARSPSRDR